MRLKRLTLQGYKTFASRTVFEFESGITAVVGPNGSGKSNVADALRWVLGEQSYSMLRGKKTADMIFAGSQSRSRAGMAQAVITLDNSDQALPLDFSEIEIARRAYRSGENEYLINGQKVRLRDVSELLATSGLAERTYTIIGQGLIDQALSLRADERRMLFEEAAGISVYKSRRAQTMRRLDETERNIERIQDILHEIRPRLRSLKRQARQAENYDQVAKDLQHLLRILYGYKWDLAQNSIREAKTTVESVKAEWTSTRKRIADYQEEISGHRSRLEALQQQYDQTIESRDGLRRKLESSRRKLAVLSERRSLLSQQLAESDEELPVINESRERARRELEEALDELQEAQYHLDKHKDAKVTYEKTVRSQIESSNVIKDRLDSYEEEATQLQQTVSRHEGQIRQLETQLESFNANGAGDALIEEIKGKIEDLLARISLLDDQRAETSILLDGKKAELTEIDNRIDLLDETIEQKERVIRAFQEEFSRLQTRRRVLSDALRKSSGKLNASKSLGQLIEVIKIPEFYRVAVESALGKNLFTWLFNREPDLWEFLDLSENNPISAAIVKHDEREKMRLPESESVVGWASSLVQVDPVFKDLVDALLGRTAVVADRRAAIRLANSLPVGYRAVSLDGILVDQSGIVEANIIDLDRSKTAELQELKDVALKMDETEASIDEAAEAVRSLESNRTGLQKLRRGLFDEIEDVEDEIKTRDGRIATLKVEHELLEQRLTFLEQQRSEEKSEAERISKRIIEFRDQVHSLGELQLELKLKQDQDREELKQLSVIETEEHLLNLEQRVDAARTIVAGRQAVVDSRRAALDQLDSQIQTIHDRRKRIAGMQENLKLESISDNSSQLETDVLKVEKTIEPLRSEMREHSESIRSMEKELLNLQHEANDIEEQYATVRIDLSKAENNQTTLRDRIIDDLGLVDLSTDEEYSQSPLPISEIVEELPKVDELPDDIEESIIHHRGQLKRFGGVYADAPIEYQALLERSEFLEGQVHDLRETKGQLRQVIDELDKLTSKAFAETVSQVDGVFGNIFAQLFGGGSAQLILTQPNDLTLSGVDIVARLPKRREQGLALMSGGERSLTATALIFSLLNVAPPPFCVLDEVDAMLDEANIERFRTQLQELSRHTQFIVITHNRGTVRAASTVYGISMGRDSASQVISIKPEEYINQ